MRKQGIEPAWRPTFVHTTDRKHDLPVADNVLDRQFEATAANEAWVADISVPQQAA